MAAAAIGFVGMSRRSGVDAVSSVKGEARSRAIILPSDLIVMITYLI